MGIEEGVNGINLVIETKERVYFGRLAKPREEGLVHLRCASMAEVREGSERERVIRETALWGVPPEHGDLEFTPNGITRVRRLGDIEKPVRRAA